MINHQEIKEVVACTFESRLQQGLRQLSHVLMDFNSWRAEIGRTKG
jgi:hypothetical protein